MIWLFFLLCCSGCGVLPIKTTTRGPAPLAADGEDDIIDETLGYFKANVLFKHFEVKGPADRVLIYLTLYITQCLKKLEGGPPLADAQRVLFNLSLESFPIPGDSGFTLGTFFPAPANLKEADLCRSYLKQVREETGRRLLQTVYDEHGQPSKFWLVFAKRRFMNKTL